MNVIEEISKEEFLASYNRHLPGKWIKFVFRYFSQSTVKEDFWIRRIVHGVLLGLFGLGMIGAIFNATHSYMAITTFTFSSIIVLVVLSMGSGAILNNLRIRKIRKELGIVKVEYEVLARLYL
jgi:hypothetical protein